MPKITLLQKVIKEDKTESSSSDTASENKISAEKASENNKTTRKGRSKNGVSLPVKSVRKKTLKKPQKGVTSSAKSVLKSTILSKRKTKVEENDIEDDLEKIKAIVGDVEKDGTNSEK